jgi:hypothetical protein
MKASLERRVCAEFLGAGPQSREMTNKKPGGRVSRRRASDVEPDYC